MPPLPGRLVGRHVVVELHVVKSRLSRAWCPRCNVSSGVVADVAGVHPDTLLVTMRLTVHCCAECGLALPPIDDEEPQSDEAGG